jgi:hypothetical protein
MSTDGVVRRNVDARIVSYALAVLSDAKDEASPELQNTFAGAATAALQAASGIVALAVACKVAATSPAVLQKFDNHKQREQFRTLMEGIGATVDEAWTGELKELLELIIVLSAETSQPADEDRIRTWAQGLFLDTRGLRIGDGGEVKPDVEIGDSPAPKRKRQRQPRSSKKAYEVERYENLVTKAIAMSIDTTKPILAGGQIMVVGVNDRGEHQLIKLRGSMFHDNIRACSQIDRMP